MLVAALSAAAAVDEAGALLHRNTLLKDDQHKPLPYTCSDQPNTRFGVYICKTHTTHTHRDTPTHTRVHTPVLA